MNDNFPANLLYLIVDMMLLMIMILQIYDGESINVTFMVASDGTDYKVVS